jgi:hypothetical protein
LADSHIGSPQVCAVSTNQQPALSTSNSQYGKITKTEKPHAKPQREEGER